MIDLVTLAIIVIAIALIFDFLNGVNDAANAIATIVVTRALTPLQAVFMAAAANFAGVLSSAWQSPQPSARELLISTA